VVTTFSVTHKNWSADERLSFYKDIRGASRCYENKGLPAPLDLNSAPPCPTKGELVASALSELQDRFDALPDMSGSVKSALTNELISSCYTIVKCKTGGAGEVTDKEINLMVKRVIDQCSTRLAAIRTTLQGINVTSTSTTCNTSAPTSVYGDAATQLPHLVLTNCQEAMLLNNNTLTVVPHADFKITLFADCDLKMMDMIQSGTFIPFIAPLAGCPKSATPPVYFTDTPNINCGSDYQEKSPYTTEKFKRYSKTYTSSTQ
jgi:hypothetical protein